MKKQFLSNLLSILMCIFLCTQNPLAFASKEVSVEINGEQLQFETPAQIINNHTMVPMRQIFEKLGFFVEWDKETEYVLATNSDKDILILFKIGSKEVISGKISEYNDGNDEHKASYLLKHIKQIEQESVIIGNRTLVPIRMVSEIAGYKVEWDNINKRVLISNNGYVYSYDNISTDISNINSHINKGLYLEAMDLCNKTKSTHFLSTDDISKLNTLYNNAKTKYDEYEYSLKCADISTEIKQINNYMNKGLYIEAMNLCNKTKKEKILSQSNISKLDNLYSTAKSKYDDYEKKLKNKPISDSEKKFLYDKAKQIASYSLRSPATAIWPAYNDKSNTYSRNSDGGISCWIHLEAMNGFGAYGKVTVYIEVDSKNKVLNHLVY